MRIQIVDRHAEVGQGVAGRAGHAAQSINAGHAATRTRCYDATNTRRDDTQRGSAREQCAGAQAGALRRPRPPRHRSTPGSTRQPTPHAHAITFRPHCPPSPTQAPRRHRSYVPAVCAHPHWRKQGWKRPSGKSTHSQHALTSQPRAFDGRGGREFDVAGLQPWIVATACARRARASSCAGALRVANATAAVATTRAAATRGCSIRTTSVRDCVT